MRWVQVNMRTRAFEESAGSDLPSEDYAKHVCTRRQCPSANERSIWSEFKCAVKAAAISRWAMHYAGSDQPGLLLKRIHQHFASPTTSSSAAAQTAELPQSTRRLLVLTVRDHRSNDKGAFYAERPTCARVRHLKQQPPTDGLGLNERTNEANARCRFLLVCSSQRKSAAVLLH